MERVRINDLESYLDALYSLDKIGIKEYMLVGRGDSMRIVITQKRIKSSLLYDFITTYACDIVPSVWVDEAAIEIILMKRIVKDVKSC